RSCAVVSASARASVRRTHSDADAASFGDIPGCEHLRANRRARGEAMVRRTALTVVVEAVDGGRGGRARAICIGHCRVEHIALELPILVAQGAFAAEPPGRIEMRARRREGRRKESAYRNATRQLRIVGIERLPRTGPSGKHSAIELADLIRVRGDEVVTESGVVVLHGD